LGVAATSKQGTVKSNHRTAYNQAISQISAQLKNYVTACGCDKGGACPAPNCTMISGPNSNATGTVASWYMNGSPGPSGNIVDSAGNVWALKCGVHTLTNLVSAGTPNLEAAPYGGTMSYTVTWPGGSCAGIPSMTDAPAISFTANWTEP
jgi:hypothetical protein